MFQNFDKVTNSVIWCSIASYVLTQIAMLAELVLWVGNGNKNKILYEWMNN